MDAEMLEKLKKPEAYLHDVYKVGMVETHISWVFLTEKFAYKVKKPVKFTFLDFSTLEKRRECCENEVKLNSRLCPEMYLGVVPIVQKEGNVHFGGVGEPIEYAVKMRRYPEERRMDHLLGRGMVTEGEIKQIAKIVSAFHSRIMKIEDRKYSSPEVVKKQVDDLALHRETIEKARGRGKDVDSALKACAAFMERNGGLFLQRQKGGFVRDCHGDLHSANVFLGEEPCIFDCIEFNREFRYIDTASEIAFMAMDLDAFGKEALSNLFVNSYVSESGDREALELLDYYKCYRANVRAKVAAIDYARSQSGDSKERIWKYARLMEKYASEL